MTRWGMGLGAGLLVGVVVIPPAAAEGSSPFFRTSQTGLTKTAAVQVPDGTSSLALQGFQFSFQNGDHQIQQISLLPSSRQIDAAFNDSDGNDPFRFGAQAVRIPTMAYVPPGKCTGDSGVCTIQPVAPRAASWTGWRFVLRGFSFVARGLDDKNIEELGVEYRKSDTADVYEIRATMRDKGRPKVDFVVHYGWIPGDRFDHPGTTTIYHDGKKPIPAGGLTVEPGGSSGIAVLQGFHFKFHNGDHHLKTFELRDLTSYNAKGPTSRPKFGASFFDKNTDDPWTATIGYAILKPTALAP